MQIVHGIIRDLYAEFDTCRRPIKGVVDGLVVKSSDCRKSVPGSNPSKCVYSLKVLSGFIADNVKQGPG
jgi:hypothetical protein